MTDSASSLSYPYMNELVNSFIKAAVYAGVGAEDEESFTALGSFRVFDIDIDFRKRLYLSTHIFCFVNTLRSDPLWGCGSRFKYYLGTEIAWIALDDFDINEFKSVSAPI